MLFNPEFISRIQRLIASGGTITHNGIRYNWLPTLALLRYLEQRKAPKLHRNPNPRPYIQHKPYPKHHKMTKKRTI